MIATIEQIKEMENQTSLKETKFSVNGEMIKEIKNIIKGYKKPSDDVFKNILIEVINKTLINVKYTNGDLFVSKMLFANVNNISTDAFTLPIQFIKGIQSIKKNEVFEFEIVDTNKLLFTRNNFQQEVIIGSKDDYISFDFLEKDYFDTVETANGYEYFEYNDLKVLAKAIKSTSESDSRPALKEIEIRNKQVISTDSHRLYRAKTIFSNEYGFMINPVLIQKAIDICDKNMFLKMSVNGYRIKIQDDYSTKIYYNHYQGSYPNVDRIIPVNFSHIVEIDHATDVYNYLKPLKKELINFYMLANQNKAIFEAVLETGKIKLEVPIRTKEGLKEDFKMSFNARFFKEGLEQLDIEGFKMKITANYRPFLLEKQTSDKEMVLILPIRVM